MREVRVRLYYDVNMYINMFLKYTESSLVLEHKYDIL